MYQEIIKYIVEYGFMTVFAGTTLYFIVRGINLFFKRFEEEKKEEMPFEDLRFHPFFSEMKQWIEFKIPYLDFNDEFRNEVFRDFLRVKFKTFYNRLFEVVNNQDLSTYKPNQLQDFFLQDLRRGVKEYTTTCKEMGVPEIFIKKFQKWHTRTVLQLETNIKGFSQSNYIDTNTEKINAILHAYLGICYVLLSAY